MSWFGTSLASYGELTIVDKFTPKGWQSDFKYLLFRNPRERGFSGSVATMGSSFAYRAFDDNATTFRIVYSYFLMFQLFIMYYCWRPF